MSDANTRESEFLIIRRSGSAESEAHKGGVWKIAYADFMTAMMAFFLVMWLINATSETTKTGVANYFNPIKLSDGMQLPKKGLNDPEQLEPSSAEADEATEAGPATEGEAAADHAEAHAAAAKPEPAGAAPEAAPAGTHDAEGDGHAAERRARFTEDALFRDPYAVLAAIVAEADDVSRLVPSGGEAGPGAGAGRSGDAAERYGDPFDPPAWDAGDGVAAADRPAREPQEATLEMPAAASPRQSHAASELAEDTGQARRGDSTVSDLGDAGEAAADAEALRLQGELLRTLKQAMASRALPNVTVAHADGGVLISLADQVDFGMFAIGSAEPLPETIAIMEKIAALLKDMPGRVILRGHTDGRPFRSENYDNWRLSASRAHMAYHMLVRGGLDERRVERIEGYADRDLKLPDDPDAAENRRIDILVLQEEARS
jgi:chemotaxis protein MotB